MGFSPFQTPGALRVLASPLPFPVSLRSGGVLPITSVRAGSGPLGSSIHPGSPQHLPAPALVRVSLLPPGVQAPFLRPCSSVAPLRPRQRSPVDYSPSPCELFHLWHVAWRGRGGPTLFGRSGDAGEMWSHSRGRWGLSGGAGSSLSCAGGYRCSFGWAEVSGAAHSSLSWKGDVGFMTV